LIPLGKTLKKVVPEVKVLNEEIKQVLSRDFEERSA
jgi:hypothetical protein